MKRVLIVCAAFGCLVLMSFAITSDEPRYRNLKVLPKNITRPQLDSVMKHFTAALNVKCNFCHMRDESTGEWNFPSDENKHKLVARDMMRMTKKINKRYFDVTGEKNAMDTRLMVTCYTCHHGSKEPMINPAGRQQAAAPETHDHQHPPQP